MIVYEWKKDRRASHILKIHSRFLDLPQLVLKRKTSQQKIMSSICHSQDSLFTLFNQLCGFISIFLSLSLTHVVSFSIQTSINRTLSAYFYLWLSTTGFNKSLTTKARQFIKFNKKESTRAKNYTVLISALHDCAYSIYVRI